MKCEKCGATLNKNANFCRVCGLQLNTNSEQDNHSTVQVDEVSNSTKTNNVNLSSSNEIKKILDEMNINEKNVSEPTVTIPTNLIGKYCKQTDNDNLKEKNEETNIEKEKEKDNKDSENYLNKETVLETKKDVSENEKNEEKKEEVNEVNEKKETDKSKTENTVIEAAKVKSEIEKSSVETKELEKKQDSIVNNNVLEKNILSQGKKDEINNTESNNEIIQKNTHEYKPIEEKNNYMNSNNNSIQIDDEIKCEKKHYGRTFFIIFFIMVCLLTIAYLVYVLYSSRNELDKITDERNILQDEVEKLKTSTPNENSNSTGVIFNGYEFLSIIDNYSVSDNSLILNLNNISYTIKINKSLNFEDLKIKKDIYKKQLVDEGYKVISYGSKHVDNVDYYVFSVNNKDGKKYLIAYSKLDENAVIAFIINSKDNNVSYDLLSNTNRILSSVNKASNTSFKDIKVFIEKN